ncbi:MAG: hypothetical protein K6A71_11680 [Lachnospiraceae bacterium]|nr:hypothetical protein [Lachnospiraceae bacterium]
METEANYPIQLIAVTSTLGDITPLRFRYENGEHELITVNVDEIHAKKEMTIGKGGSIIYTCASMTADTKMLYQLRYEIGTHKWIFMKRLS